MNKAAAALARKCSLPTPSIQTSPASASFSPRSSLLKVKPVPHLLKSPHNQNGKTRHRANKLLGFVLCVLFQSLSHAWIKECE